MLVIAPSSGMAEELRARTRSTLQPSHFIWRAGVGVRTPGMVGVEAAADLVLPFAPVYLGVRGSHAWGYTTAELNGPQWASATVAEGRLGLVVSEAWSLRDVSIDVETRQAGGLTLASDRYARPTEDYRYSTVRFPAPLFTRWTVFGGVSRRWQTVDNGQDARRDFASAGVSWLRRHEAVAVVDQFGNFDTDRTETWTVAATVCVGGSNPPRDVSARVGAVVEYAWLSSVLAFTTSVGFDGERALLSVTVGLGGAHALGGPAPQASQLRQASSPHAVHPQQAFLRGDPQP